jgi:hypothetical protein
LSKIIEFRNRETLRSLIAISEKSILALKDATSNIQEQNHNSASISAQTYKDARVVKVLAIVSMIYLPASLVAVSTLPSDLLEQKLINTSQYLVLT